MLKQDRWRLLGILLAAIGTVIAYDLIHEPNEGLRQEESSVSADFWPVSPGSPKLLTYCQHDVYGYVDAVAPWQGCIGGWHPISQKQYRIGLAEEAAISDRKNSIDEVRKLNQMESVPKAIRDFNGRVEENESDLNAQKIQKEDDSEKPKAVVEKLDLGQATKFANILDKEGYAVEILNHDEEDGSILFGITSRGKKATARIYTNGILLFRSYWVGQDDFTLQEINEWNYNHRFARMYIDKDNDIVLQTDVLIPGEEFQSQEISFYTNMFFELQRVARDWISKFLNTNSDDVPENTNTKETSELNT